MKPLRNIRLLIAYDGTRFSGWQVQKKDRTVQGVLEEALAGMHKHPVGITGAGRTDSGVHARGQVANFTSDLPGIPAEKYADALNSVLPKDVLILESGEVPKAFHSRYDAKWRTYRYYILPEGNVYPWQRNYCLPVNRRPDVRRLMEMADCFLGTHDFTTFSAAGSNVKSTVRTVRTSAFFMEGRYLVYQIRGNAFLWRMVRSIVGTLLELESAGKGPEEAAAALASRDRDRAGTTAPPRGLFLHSIDYGGEHAGDEG